MDAPFRQGDRAAIFTLHDDQIVVTTTEVQDVAPGPDEGWNLVTDAGTFHVDREGVSDKFLTTDGEPARLTPTDPELDFELHEKGEGFSVVESLSDLEVSREDRLRNTVDFELPSIEQHELDGGDHGWER